MLKRILATTGGVLLAATLCAAGIEYSSGGSSSPGGAPAINVAGGQVAVGGGDAGLYGSTSLTDGTGTLIARAPGDGGPAIFADGGLTVLGTLHVGLFSGGAGTLVISNGIGNGVVLSSDNANDLNLNNVGGITNTLSVSAPNTYGFEALGLCASGAAACSDVLLASDFTRTTGFITTFINNGVTEGQINFAGALTLNGGVDSLTTATGKVTVSGATAPTTGQVLTALSGTTANWQTVSGAASNFTVGGTETFTASSGTGSTIFISDGGGLDTISFASFNPAASVTAPIKLAIGTVARNAIPPNTIGVTVWSVGAACNTSGTPGYDLVWTDTTNSVACQTALIACNSAPFTQFAAIAMPCSLPIAGAGDTWTLSMVADSAGCGCTTYPSIQTEAASR